MEEKVRRDALLNFGEFVKNFRLKQGMSLRGFCTEHGLDPGNISKLERGLYKVPQSRDRLENLAKCLDIEEDSEDWYQYFDLAACCNGELPSYLLSDAELVKKLPIVFRTLRGGKVDSEKLDTLAELIRRA